MPFRHYWIRVFPAYTCILFRTLFPFSGIPQGKLIKRQRLPKNDLGEYWHWKDLNLGINVTFYGKVFHLYDCDAWTKVQTRQDWLIAAGAYPGFCSMKRLEVFLLPLDGMLVHRRALSHNLLGFPTIWRYPFILLGRERQCESDVSCPITQHKVPGHGSNPGHSLRSRVH